jgi:hypothetical protein
MSMSLFKLSNSQLISRSSRLIKKNVISSLEVVKGGPPTRSDALLKRRRIFEDFAKAPKDSLGESHKAGEFLVRP